MKRILHLQKAAGIGGAEKHLCTLLPGLQKAGFEIHYVILEPPASAHLNDTLIELMRTADVICHRILLPQDYNPLSFIRLKNLISKIQPDIVHTHLIQGDFWGALLKLISGGFKLISSKHGYDEVFQAKHELNPKQIHNHKNIYYWLTRFALNQCDKIITISDGLNTLFSVFSAFPNKIKTIRYGYLFNPASGVSIEPAEYFLYIGRLIPFKHPELLINAYIKYHNAGGTLPLKIAGSGSSESEMKQSLKSVGLEHKVEFLDRISNPEYLLSKAVCLCVSSLSEGFGLVSLEAMNAGIPVIAFDVPALNEVIHHNISGFLCTPGDTDEFALNMQRLAEDTDLRIKMGAAGKERLYQHFSPERMIQSTQQVYGSLI